MRAKVRRLAVSGPADVLKAVEAARRDLIDAGGVEELILVAPTCCRSPWISPTKSDVRLPPRT